MVHRIGIALFASVLLVASLASIGCKAIAMPWLMWGEEPTKPVPAEFPHLAGKKVCILVWADADTRFEFQHVQYELSEFLVAALKPNVKGITFVPNRGVVDYQRADADWDRKPPAKVGAKFSADRVLMIDLTQYSTREADNPHLYRAHIAASVKVYGTDDFDAGPVYKTTLETLYPTGAAGEWGTSEDSIRKSGMEAFAAEVAGKFYERQVKVK